MNKIDAQSWKADMPDFREKTKAFYNGEMSKGDYKGYSGRYGKIHQYALEQPEPGEQGIPVRALHRHFHRQIRNRHQK